MSLLPVHFMWLILRIGTLFMQKSKPVIVLETGSVKVKMPAGYILSVLVPLAAALPLSCGSL